MIGRNANTVLRRSRQQARPPRKVCPFCFEADHIGGHNHVPHITLDVCQFHHALLTELRLASGADMNKQPTTIKSIEMALRALAVTGRVIASAVETLCDGVEFCAEKLTSVYQKQSSPWKDS